MIAIKEYKQIIEELAAKVNDIADKVLIRNVVTAVQEEQLIKKIKDLGDVVLAGNVPGAEIAKEGYDDSKGKVVLFVIKKVAAGSESDADETETYAALQTIALTTVRLLMNNETFACNRLIQAPKKVQVEWEYNIYGGFNGLSIGFDIADGEEV